MAMFRGTQEAKIDEKGRLKLPADFMKLIVEKNYGSQFFITSRDGKVAEVWPMPEWEKEEQKKADLPEDDMAKLTWLEFVNGWGGVAEIDKQDRLMLPRKIRERFNLVNEEVDVTGFQRYLVVRSQRMAEERLDRMVTPANSSVMSIDEAKRILAARENSQPQSQ
jgi:MraZ protein